MSTFRLDKYIKKGYVTVNGEPAKKPDIKISPDDDEIVFQNQPISLSEFEYYLLNKPAGYVSATKDNTAPTVLTLIDSKRKDLFPVGRLDKDTEGLLIITNDGALSHRLLSPKRHVDKTYFAIVDGIVTKADVALFEKGLEIGDDDLDIAMPAQLIIEKIDPEQNISHVTITIQEGKFHQVKRMFQAVEKKVLYLKRIAFGPIELPHDLPLGDSRILSKEEISMLQKF